MSKKNKLSTRVNRHQADLQREKADAAARKVKLESKAIKKKNSMQDVSQPGKAKKKKGVKLKRNVVVKGIRIRKAEDKEKIRELLREEEENKMGE